MNPFETLQYMQEQYKTYVYTFQKIKNPHIRRWIFDRIDNGSLLWRAPHVQLNQRFTHGETLQEMVSSELLHPNVLKIFTRRDSAGKLTDKVINPYQHQSQSIESILAKNANTVITTGTSSGKSFCFGIPIVSECLKMKNAGIKGIKAVFVYPMNALANSQYEDFSERLNKSGLKIGLYTGDTPTGREEALKNFTASNRSLPYDSEVISRTDIQENPPDILMTNYVMLDLLLTRFNDRNLFPEEGTSPLKFLVLDEVHTYSGKKGADVAALIRRLKERTQTQGSLRCIATSATIEKTGDEDANQVIASFAQDLFGEPFDPTNVISETYLSIPLPEPDPLPDEIRLTDKHLEGFDNSPNKIRAIVEALTGNTIVPEESTPEKIGSILLKNRTIQFLIQKLSDQSVSITDLINEYQAVIRSNKTLGECRIEIFAALLTGTQGKIILNDEYQPIFVPKLHTFFSQGREISSCLSSPESPHLNDRGDALCDTCAQEQKQRATFPLVFCRSCGQEFYGATIKEDSTVIPRDMDVIDLDGQNLYFYTGLYDEGKIPIPDDWREKKRGSQELGKCKREYEPHVPEHKRFSINQTKRSLKG
ncbi:MAG TPA: DEAD/DEAH box helicase [Deltaproteobacteria bacterium]|nr:DEAD/DEAH box helicase [Deltaproteobacteria bacterium]